MPKGAAEPEDEAQRRIQRRRRKRAKKGTGPAGIEFLESRRLMSADFFIRAVPERFHVRAAGNGDHLVFARQPAAITAGESFSAPVTVNILNPGGTIDTASSAAVTLTISGNGSITGTTTVIAAAGVAAFPNLTVTSAGTFKWTASAAALKPVASAPFDVLPDISSARLVVTQTAPATAVGKKLAPTIVVAVEDPFGNLIKDNRTPVSLVIAGGPRGGTLTGMTTVTAKNGIATFGALSFPLAGTYTLQAFDPELADTTSDPFREIISQGLTTITAPHSGGAAVFGGTITLSAGLRSTADHRVPFTGTAALLDQNSNVLGSVTVGASGQLKFVVTGLGLGTYACTIAYSGDANHTSLVSPPFPLRITAAPTHVALASSSTSLVIGQELQLNASVTTPFHPSAPPTGTVIFLDRGVQIGSVAVDSAGKAALMVPAVTPGSHQYSAVYSGDGEFRYSAARARNLIVTKVPTVTVLRGPMSGTLGVGQLVALMVNIIVPSMGQNPPTGTITFKDGGQVIATLPVDAAGSARLTTSFSRRGAHRLTAVYSGDAVNQPSTSGAFLEFVGG